MNRTHHRIGSVMVSLLLLGGLILWSGDASSYTMNRTKAGKAIIWCKSSVVVYVDTTHVKNVPGVVDAVRAAFATWNSFGVPTKVQVVAVNKRLKADSNDDMNVVRWEQGEWKWASHHVAQTVRRAGSVTGCIKEADIILNAKTFGWGVLSKNKANLSQYDVQNVLAHEAGHFFGLDHSDQGEATMYSTTPQGETSKRSLSQDDLNGIVHVVQEFNSRYSLSNDPAQPISTEPPGEPEDLDRMGGCSVGGDTSPPAPWLLVLLGLMGLSRWRRGRSGR